MSVLKNTREFYQYDSSDILVHNLSNWISYGLLEAGAYTNVTFSSAMSGYTTLKTSYDDRNGGSRYVYEGLGPSWVWEEDISLLGSSDQPHIPSGIYVNNTFYLTSSTSGNYSHFIDFQNGRVVFNNQLGKNDVVKCEYTFRDVAIYQSDSEQWKTIINEYQSRFDNLNINNPSGLSMTLKDKRVWLPCIVIENESNGRRGLMLGGGEIEEHRVFYHIFSDLPFTNKKLSDLLNNQQQTVLNLYNINTAPFPYEYNGSLNPSGVDYKTLSNKNNDNFWTHAFISNSFGSPIESKFDLHRAEVVQEIEIDRYIYTY
jgi:hypothetical protein